MVGHAGQSRGRIAAVNDAPETGSSAMVLQVCLLGSLVVLYDGRHVQKGGVVRTALVSFVSEALKGDSTAVASLSRV